MRRKWKQAWNDLNMKWFSRVPARSRGIVQVTENDYANDTAARGEGGKVIGEGRFNNGIGADWYDIRAARNPNINNISYAS